MENRIAMTEGQRDIPRPPLEEIPLDEGEAAPPVGGPPQEAFPKPGWIPLKPVAVMPVLDIKNEIFAGISKSSIEFWAYTPQERADISEIIDACGVTAPAWAQLIGAILARDAAKFIELRITKGEKPEVKGTEK